MYLVAGAPPRLAGELRALPQTRGLDKGENTEGKEGMKTAGVEGKGEGGEGREPPTAKFCVRVFFNCLTDGACPSPVEKLPHQCSKLDRHKFYFMFIVLSFL